MCITKLKKIKNASLISSFFHLKTCQWLPAPLWINPESLAWASSYSPVKQFPLPSVSQTHISQFFASL